ncbi:toxin-antitoxin system YwqK family antitoxin [Acinetobacter shaoyimingii]|uniref:Toxin-antitoxin system YwqK family antitoxin n=1 Tax=Acinetobacter shaoyimingii TaxID=2715164 RepID=A0A6G8RS08_9GAMM|nr:toxin-antitoxin system YwqK family antitoxin [Acinetobacter shaoyimingii]QIO04657.1 toxin-antitoxin system YwqK family antitoxin [Acinetobacter shaoyimingii]
MNKIILSSLLLMTSFHTYAEGYLNENMVVFISEEDPDDSPWKNNPQCLAVSKSIDKGLYENQYMFQNGNPLTSVFLSNNKIKKGECESLIHFPDGIQGSGTFESYYPNGKQRSRIEYQDGEYEGKLQFWFPNGLKQQESRFENGQSHGDYKIWHPNGQLALSMKYQNGVQQGMRQRWYETGEPWTYVRFENDRMVGELKQWYKNGKLERLGQYRDGVRHGTYKVWYNDGEPEAVLQYNMGKITEAQCWYESGKAKTQAQCLSSYKDEE